MKLSDAVILGDTLKKCDAGSFRLTEGGGGCAICGAVLAMGGNAEDGLSEFHRIFPWITNGQVDHISGIYFDVEDGKATIEDVAAYIRTIEPADEPQVQEPAITNGGTDALKGQSKRGEVVCKT